VLFCVLFYVLVLLDVVQKILIHLTMHLEGLKIGAININLDTLEITEAK
jgi:hypothetical protein